MAAFDIIQDGVPFGACVYSIVLPPLNGGPDNHRVTLPPFPLLDPNLVDECGWIIEACGVSMDAADTAVVSVEDPDLNGPLLSIDLSGATSTVYRILAGEWFPQNSVVVFTTPTGVGMRIRLTARQDKA